MENLEDEGWLDFSVLMHCAVYALVRRGVVVYVGKSKSLGTRLHNHVRKRGKVPSKKSMYGTNAYDGVMFDAIWVKPCMLGELDSLEIAMIKKYQPKHNKNHRGDLPPPEVPLEDLLATLPMLPKPPNPEPRQQLFRRR